MNQDDDRYIQALTKLGLTLLQTTIYITLIHTGKAGIMKISKISKIARPEVYRVLPSLEKKGLVEKIIGNPTMYTPVPLKHGFSMLLQQKTKESTELQEETKALLGGIHENSVNEFKEKESLQFVITNEMKLFIKRFDKAVVESQRSVDLICTCRDLPKLLFNHQQSFKTAIDKGIKICVITEKVENQRSIEIIESLKKNSLFTLKYTFEDTPVCMLMCDDKKVNMQLSDGVVPSLFSNNPNMVKIATAYFKRLWSRAEEYPSNFVTQKDAYKRVERPATREIEVY
jgi:sugar-specific transcriptional regulator TrmB